MDSIEDIFRESCEKHLGNRIETQRVNDLFIVRTRKYYIDNRTLDEIQSNIFKLDSISVPENTIKLSFILR